jgi:undecaprenyl-diphosphatase
LDFTLYKTMTDLIAGHGAVEETVRFVAVDGQFLFVGLLAALFLARGKWRSVNGRHGVVAAGLAALLALAVAQVIAGLWDRPRPYEAHPGDAHLLISPSPDPSFPSDHAAAAFAIAVSIFLRHRKAGWLALAMAGTLALSRVAAGTHYPSDVAGGALLGTLAALLLWAPQVRRPAHALADFAGQAYERLMARALRQPSR